MQSRRCSVCVLTAVQFSPAVPCRLAFYGRRGSVASELIFAMPTDLHNWSLPVCIVCFKCLYTLFALSSHTAFSVHPQAVVSSLVSSLPGLFDVTVLMAFYFAIFGTMFVLLFGGELRRRCANPDFRDAYTDAEGVVQVRLGKSAFVFTSVGSKL